MLTTRVTMATAPRRVTMATALRDATCAAEQSEVGWLRERRTAACS